MRWRILRSLVVANAFGSTVVAAGAIAFHRIYPGGIEPNGFVSSVLVGYAVFVAGCAIGLLEVRRRFAGVERWLAEERLPSTAEVVALVRQPRRQASFPMPYWAIAFAAVVTYQLARLDYHPGLLGFAKELSAFIAGAVTAWALSYLLVERALRPAFREAAGAGVGGVPTTMKTFPRLLFAWMVSCGLPMVTLTFALVGLSGRQQEVFVPVVYVAVLYSAIGGIVVTVFAARAVADPLNEIRGALRTIAGGELNVHIPVDDGGEIGLLQSDFNRMAAELRDRERLRVIFGRQVGAEVARRALDGATGLGGERCTASVMFVKVTLAEEPSDAETPEQVIALLNGFFDLMVESVALEGGIVNKFKSDGAVCVFGAPEAHDEHAGRALRAARALRVAVSDLGAEHGLDTAIAISSGEVVAGNVGSSDRYEYTVIGDPVNEAARLLEAAAAHPSRVLASAAAIGSAGPEAVNWIASRNLPLRGRRRPTVAYAPWNV
jgi:adenylate cyclase